MGRSRTLSIHASKVDLQSIVEAIVRYNQLVDHIIRGIGVRLDRAT